MGIQVGGRIKQIVKTDKNALKKKKKNGTAKISHYCNVSFKHHQTNT